MPWIKYTVQNFTKPENLVVDSFAGTFSVVQACMPLPRHGITIGFEVDPGGVIEATSHQILQYARQVFCKESNADRAEHFRKVAEVYIYAVGAIEK